MVCEYEILGLRLRVRQISRVRWYVCTERSDGTPSTLMVVTARREPELDHNPLALCESSSKLPRIRDPYPAAPSASAPPKLRSAKGASPQANPGGTWTGLTDLSHVNLVRTSGPKMGIRISMWAVLGNEEP